MTSPGHASTLAQRLARYANELRFEELPDSTIHEVKRRFIDSLGCAMGAISGDPGRIAREDCLKPLDLGSSGAGSKVLSG